MGSVMTRVLLGAALVWAQTSVAQATSGQLGASQLTSGLQRIGAAFQGPIIFWMAAISLIAGFFVLFIQGREFDSFAGRAAMAGLIFGGLGTGGPALLQSVFGLSSSVVPW